VGVRHAIGVGNGTDAIWIGLMAVGVGPGDEVILPSHTFVATAAAVKLVGATPVLADIGPDRMVDPASVEAVPGALRGHLWAFWDDQLLSREAARVLRRRRRGADERR